MPPNLRSFFLISLAGLLFFPLFLPMLHLNVLAPFLALVCYRRSLLQGLWIACGCGFLLDLLSNGPVGLSCWVASLAMVPTFFFKHLFFEDKLSTLSFVTFFFSLFFTLFQTLLSPFFGGALHLSAAFFCTDFLFMPLLDAVGALCLYSLPFHLSRKVDKLRS